VTPTLLLRQKPTGEHGISQTCLKNAIRVQIAELKAIETRTVFPRSIGQVLAGMTDPGSFGR
jgi:hypothetical protein